MIFDGFFAYLCGDLYHNDKYPPHSLYINNTLQILNPLFEMRDKVKGLVFAACSLSLVDCWRCPYLSPQWPLQQQAWVHSPGMASPSPAISSLCLPACPTPPLFFLVSSPSTSTLSLFSSPSTLTTTTTTILMICLRICSPLWFHPLAIRTTLLSTCLKISLLLPTRTRTNCDFTWHCVRWCIQSCPMLPLLFWSWRLW